MEGIRIRPVSRFALGGAGVAFEVAADESSTVSVRPCDEASEFGVFVRDGSEPGGTLLTIQVPRDAPMA